MADSEKFVPLESYTRKKFFLYNMVLVLFCYFLIGFIYLFECGGHIMSR